VWWLVFWDLQVFEQLVGGAGAVDADEDLHAALGWDLGDRGGEHGEVVGHGVGSGVARAQQHLQALAGVGAPRRERVEAEAFLEGGGRPVLVGVRGDQGGVQVDDDPSGEQLARHDQPGEPAWAGAEQLPHVLTHGCHRLGDLAQRRVVGRGQGAVHGGVRRWFAEHAGLVFQQCDVGHAGGAQHDRHRHRHQHRAPVPPARTVALGHRLAQRPGQPDGVGALS